MTAPEVRELVAFCSLLFMLIALLVMLARARHGPAPIPPTVAPLAQPVEEQVRDVRHRVANVEQQVQVLPDHAIRLRTMEREVGEVRSTLGALTQGLNRVEHQLNLLLQHHLQPEAPK